MSSEIIGEPKISESWKQIPISFRRIQEYLGSDNNFNSKLTEDLFSKSALFDVNQVSNLQIQYSTKSFSYSPETSAIFFLLTLGFAPAIASKESEILFTIYDKQEKKKLKTYKYHIDASFVVSWLLFPGYLLTAPFRSADTGGVMGNHPYPQRIAFNRFTHDFLEDLKNQEFSTLIQKRSFLIQNKFLIAFPEVMDSEVQLNKNDIEKQIVNFLIAKKQDTNLVNLKKKSYPLNADSVKEISDGLGKDSKGLLVFFGIQKNENKNELKIFLQDQKTGELIKQQSHLLEVPTKEIPQSVNTLVRLFLVQSSLVP